ncbi:UNVERIFIED_CONTAM: Glucosamine 6-phosphate N-acetyltransferase [Sesamum radiatum]|uniref:Glucosamine 6-phosphate N-acetyltransferase n=1 Tax=Sesamum radiatum TaxID=300843 RepID=A0AAW2KRD3_SESRA
MFHFSEPLLQLLRSCSKPKMQTANSSTEEEIFRVRKLEISDKNKGFVELLQQLTVCDSISDEAFRERFEELAKCGDDHLICVIEDNNSGKIVATGVCL